MNIDIVTSITVFVLALLVGSEVISKVPATLHTPLMSGANAIHGVVLVGVIVVAGRVHDPVGAVLVGLAATFATVNVVGGFIVTDRMLGMFHTAEKPPAQKPPAQKPPAQKPSGEHR